MVPRTQPLLVLLLAAGACQAGAASEYDASRGEAPLRVHVVPVGTQPVPETFTLTGTLMGGESSMVAAGAAGVVARTEVERGDLVQRGQVLIRIDARTARLGAAEARASVQAAEAQSRLAQADCARADQLYRSGAFSQAEHERARAQCASQQAAATAARERQRVAQETLSDTVVRAPFQGMVVQRNVSVGEYVRPELAVAQVVTLDPLRLELTVPEALVERIRPGQPVDFHVAAFADRGFEGVVRFVSPSVQQSSRSLVIEALVPNPQGELRPGMFARADVRVGTATRLVVPAAAVRVDEATRRVFVVHGDQAEERLVEAGPDLDGQVAITSGVQPGEQVIAPLPAALRDGTRIVPE